MTLSPRPRCRRLGRRENDLVACYGRSGGTSVPIWSDGLLSCLPFLAFAVIQRRKRDWAVFAAYLAVTVALITTARLVNSNSVWAGVAGPLIIALGICAAIHACILFRPGRAQPSRAEAAWRRNQEVMQGARNRIERRNHARHIVQTDPALARELRIGRPDLPREYDDGGLVDVNRVPGAVLAAQLGLTQQEVTNVIAPVTSSAGSPAQMTCATKGRCRQVGSMSSAT